MGSASAFDLVTSVLPSYSVTAFGTAFYISFLQMTLFALAACVHEKEVVLVTYEALNSLKAVISTLLLLLLLMAALGRMRPQGKLDIVQPIFGGGAELFVQVRTHRYIQKGIPPVQRTWSSPSLTSLLWGWPAL